MGCSCRGRRSGRQTLRAERAGSPSRAGSCWVFSRRNRWQGGCAHSTRSRRLSGRAVVAGHWSGRLPDVAAAFSRGHAREVHDHSERCGGPFRRPHPGRASRTGQASSAGLYIAARSACGEVSRQPDAHPQVERVQPFRCRRNHCRSKRRHRRECGKGPRSKASRAECTDNCRCCTARRSPWPTR